MNKFFLLLLLSAFSGIKAQQTAPIVVSTNNTSLIFSVGEDKKLLQRYMGPKLPGDPLNTSLEAYPGAGMEFQFEPFMRVVHADGNPSLELRFQGSNQEKQANGATQTNIVLKDEVYNTEVTVHFLAYPAQDIIKTWTDIRSGEKNTITLTNYASSMLHFDAEHYWLTQFHGDWAKEMKVEEAELTTGSKIIDSKLGTRASKFNFPGFYLTLGAQAATETEGSVVAGTLAWTGNFRFSFEIDNSNTLHVLSGINQYASDYRLEPGKTFTTPEFIFTFSNQGRGRASRNLHTWARKYAVLDGEKPRLTLLNNWEATGMKFNQDKLVSLFANAKKLGVDLFLLDDGWFGDKFPRDDDKTSLGDWMVDKKKLPGGIPYLVSEAAKQELKFGIWVEPEMVSPKSELYQQHPEWVLKLPNRAEAYERNQLLLDLTNPKVQDFVFKIMDDLFTQNPGLAFIKWDCNRTMTNAYSAYLKANQSHLYIDYTLGLYKVLERVRAKYPHIPMMLCSGGGGRADYQALKYFTEFWPSDNTDGLERIFIQWNNSYFFPSNTISAHITHWGKQSLKFRTDVAMMGKMGYDLDLKDFTPEEMEFSHDAITEYKRLSDVIWYGDMYRLVSPYENNRAVLTYVDTTRQKSVLFAYYLQDRFWEKFSPVRLQGLDPLKTYVVKEINLFPGTKSGLAVNNKTYTGDYLMNIGIPLHRQTQYNAHTSVVLEITALK